MAPSKRKQPETPLFPPGRVTRSAASSTIRITRSSGSKLFEGELPLPRRTKKAKQEEPSPPVKPAAAASSDKPAASSSSGAGAGSGSKKTIIIEHCEQSDAFQTKANELKEALEQEVPDITVTLNPKKPRKGCFEVRQGDEKFITLLKLKDPFDELNELNIGDIVSDISKKIKNGSDLADKIGGLTIKQEDPKQE